MSRASNDQYKLTSGELVEVAQGKEPPTEATLWRGYDYTNQMWVYEGKEDTRTLEVIKEQMETLNNFFASI